MKSFLIIGMGKFGHHMCHNLAAWRLPTIYQSWAQNRSSALQVRIFMQNFYSEMAQIM